jgi:Icc-related predicted phosphoesterase
MTAIQAIGSVEISTPGHSLFAVHDKYTTWHRKNMFNRIGDELEQARRAPSHRGSECKHYRSSNWPHGGSDVLVLYDHVVGLLLHARDVWLPVIFGRGLMVKEYQRILEEANKQVTPDIGMAFHHSSCVRRAGLEIFHERLTLRWLRLNTIHLSRSEPSVLYIDTGTCSKQLEVRRLSEFDILRDTHFRVVAISDTHLLHEDLGQLPKADILVHAGDLGFEESRAFDQTSSMYAGLRWLGTRGAKHCVLVGGNHDYHMSQIGNEAVAEACRKRGVTYIHDEMERYHDFRSLDRSITVWGSAATKAKNVGAMQRVTSGNVAFQVDPETGAKELLNKGKRARDNSGVKLDILVTHSPPTDTKLHHVGCFDDSYDEMVKELAPRLLVCGHSHNEEDLLKGRVEWRGETLAVNAAVTNQWNALWYCPIVIDLPVSATG